MTAIKVNLQNIQESTQSKTEDVISGLSRGNYGFLIGPPGVGKGYFLLSLAIELATGNKILGLSNNQKKVLYWPSEDGIDTVAERLEKPLLALNEDYSKKTEDNFFLWDGKEPICSKNGIGNIDALVKFCLGEQIELLILDTLRETVSTAHEVDDDQTIKLALQQLSEKANVAILISHHPTKEIIKGKDVVTSVCGSGLSLTQANSRYTLYLQSKKGKLNIRHVKSNNVPMDEVLDHDLSWSGESLLFSDKAAYNSLMDCTSSSKIKKEADLANIDFSEQQEQDSVGFLEKEADITKIDVPENFPKMRRQKPILDENQLAEYEAFLKGNESNDE